MDLQLPVQSEPITTKVVSSNPTDGGVYLIKYCDKLCQRLAILGRQFSAGTQVSSTNETDFHDMTDILLKEELNTTTLTLCILQYAVCPIIKERPLTTIYLFYFQIDLKPIIMRF